LLIAEESLTEDDGSVSNAVDRCRVHSPCRYIPPVQVAQIEKRKSIPLNTNEVSFLGTTEIVAFVQSVARPTN